MYQNRLRPRRHLDVSTSPVDSRRHKKRDESMHSDTSKHSSDMDVDQPQNKASFTTLTNLNKIDESKSEVSQDDNKSQSSNNASEDSSDDEEVMIKQESNYEGKGDHDTIEEENKDQILNDDQDFSIIQKLSSGVKGKALLPQKDIAEIIERNYKSGISEKQLLSKKIRGISPATVYRHYDKLRNKGTSLRKKGSGAKTVITSEMKDAINKLVEKDDSVSLKQLTEKVNLMGFEVSKESIRKHLIGEGFKSLAPVEAYELTNEQKKRRVEWCKEHQDFDWNSVIFTDETIFRCGKKKKRRWMKEGSKI